MNSESKAENTVEEEISTEDISQEEDFAEEVNANTEDQQNVEIENEEGDEITALNNKYLRLYAEFENFRRRTAKENLDLIESANNKLLGSLSDVVENFDRAFAEDSAEATHEDFKKGIVLIQNQLKQTLTQYGLAEVNPVGEVFDPNVHEALMRTPSEEVPENHIVTVFQKGFKVKNKVIKHAKVIVSSGPQA